MFDTLTATLASGLRFGAGAAVAGAGARPERTLELYEFEACPFCKRVREACSMLDLSVLVRPCPKQGKRYRPWVTETGGRAQFPFLVDPNDPEKSEGFYESDAILQHLFARYGSGRIPRSLSLPLLPLLTAQLGAALRLPRGISSTPSTPPEKPLELYGYEADPGSRQVRETLCELELPYLLHNVASGSPRRQELRTRAGALHIPYLLDPNQSEELSDPAKICRYLVETYSDPP